MDFSKVIAIEIPEGKVAKIEDKGGNVLWNALADPAKYAYGIRWNHSVSDSQATTACERIGNLELHKTLPVQSKFACCIHQGTEIKYWCHQDDSRFRKDNTGYVITGQNIKTASLDNVTANPPYTEYCPDKVLNKAVDFSAVDLNKFPEVKTAVTTYKYLYAYIKVNGIVCRVNKIDFTNKIFLVKVVDGTLETITNATVEFGCSINGYDGEIGVYTPRFYLWSVDNDGTNNEVWMSEKRCSKNARQVKPHIISTGRCGLLRTQMNDEKWGWLNTLTANSAVNVVNYRPQLRGGNNNSSFDSSLGTDNFRTLLGKGASSIPLSSMRTYSQKVLNGQVLYYQIWSAIVWCYFIEYANFNVKKAYTNNLTSEGYHQGGLGDSLTSCNSWSEYNESSSILSIDYTLELGNNTGTKIKPAISFTYKSSANTTWKQWTIDRVTAAIDSTNNNILNITSIPKLYSDWSIQATFNNVGGTHKYKITGLTDGQSIIFKRQQGNLTIDTDGEYDVDWGSNTSSRNIIFGKVQEACNIKITILSAPSITYTINQKQFEVPHYRGFNGFWYGDVWLNIENFLSKYDNTSNKRKFYFTEDVTKFSNSIDNKEHIIEIAPNLNGWASGIAVGNKADLITNKVGNPNFINCYRWDNTVTSVCTIFAGGAAWVGSGCGLASLNCSLGVGSAGSDLAFAKCYILK